MEVRFRGARAEDAVAVAGLHADSWQRHYRGAYSDAFLDGGVHEVLTRVWTTRLAKPTPRTSTILAELGGEVIGLAHTRFDEDATWGALLDNLHVRYGLKGHGIGTRLFHLTAHEVSLRGSGLYLWVLEQNVAAQGFYDARGGARLEKGDVPPPAGDPRHLNGRPQCFRYSWPAPSPLDDAATRVTPDR